MDEESVDEELESELEGGESDDDLEVDGDDLVEGELGDDDLVDDDLVDLVDDDLVDDDLVDDDLVDDDLVDDDLVVDEDVVDADEPDDAEDVGATVVPHDEDDDEDEDEPDPDDVEASLDVILKDRLVIEDAEDDDDTPDVDDRSETGAVIPKRPEEFVCQSCFLVKHPSQLADTTRGYCRDCV